MSCKPTDLCKFIPDGCVRHVINVCLDLFKTVHNVVSHSITEVRRCWPTMDDGQHHHGANMLVGFFHQLTQVVRKGTRLWSTTEQRVVSGDVVK